MNVLRAVSENGIIAIGMTIILILGDIDLSVGSVVGLISTGCAYLMVKSGLGICTGHPCKPWNRSIVWIV